MYLMVVSKRDVKDLYVQNLDSTFIILIWWNGVGWRGRSNYDFGNRSYNWGELAFSLRNIYNMISKFTNTENVSGSMVKLTVCLNEWLCWNISERRLCLNGCQSWRSCQGICRSMFETSQTHLTFSSLFEKVAGCWMFVRSGWGLAAGHFLCFDS